MQTTFAVPRHVALCPHCGKDGELWLEVDEWEDGGVPTETGCHVSCAKETERASDIHYQMPYVYWLPLTSTVYTWAAEHVRIVPDEAEMRERLQAWNEGRPLVVDLAIHINEPTEYERSLDLEKLRAWTEGKPL